jgi:HEAT repeat protein
MIDDEIKDMVLDYMEKGFLENIVDMFKHDESLYPLIIDMIQDERMRVRLGATALVEEFSAQMRDTLSPIVPALILLLTNPNPTIRGDAANLLGIIRHRDTLPFLMAAEKDEDMSVREIVKDSIEEIKARW